jgi:hypothetical protein
MALSFSLYPLRFHFRAIDSLFFPEGKSGNVVRGAFGNTFRRLVCRPDCRDARTCEHRLTCPYAWVFERSLPNDPSGMADPPRPFVFRAAHLDGKRLAPGERFFFDVNLFDLQGPLIAYFVASFAQLAHEGLGPRRGRAVLEGVMRERPVPERLVFDGPSRRLYEPVEPWAVDLTPHATPVERLRIQFETPTEIKAGNQLAARPEFATLFARVRDRLSALRSLYGEGALPIDFRAMGERAAAVRLSRCDLRHVSMERRSVRTGQVHPLGGFVGSAEYEGDLAEFVPFLRAAEWTGVGRQTVWGKGAIRVALPWTSRQIPHSACTQV